MNSCSGCHNKHAKKKDMGETQAFVCEHIPKDSTLCVCGNATSSNDKKQIGNCSNNFTLVRGNGEDVSDKE